MVSVCVMFLVNLVSLCRKVDHCFSHLFEFTNGILNNINARYHLCNYLRDIEKLSMLYIFLSYFIFTYHINMFLFYYPAIFIKSNFVILFVFVSNILL